MQEGALLQNLKSKAFSIIILIGSIVLYIVAGNFDYIPKEGRLGPDFWPKTILFLLIILSALDVGVALIKGGSKGKEEARTASKDDNEHEQEEQPVRYPKLLYLGMAMTVAYVLLINFTGFFLATFAYLVGFMYAGRYRKPLVIWVSSLIGSLFLLFIFVKLVYVSLPVGSPPFDQITFLLYSLMNIN